MRKLKFRGCEVDDHFHITKVVRGDKAIIEGGQVTVIFDEHNDAHTVDPDSVKQLIFVDYNGKEVYEGDIITMHPDFQPAPEIEADFTVLAEEERWQLVREVYEY